MASDVERLIERGRRAFNPSDPFWSHERMEVGQLLTEALAAASTDVRDAALAEREACAKVAEQAISSSDADDWYSGCSATGRIVSAFIRARSSPEPFA